MQIRSVVPHLLRAIAEKREGSRWPLKTVVQIPTQRRLQSSRRSQRTPKVPSSVSSSKPKTAAKVWPAQITQIEDPAQARSFSLYFKISTGFAFAIGLYCTYLSVNWRQSVANHAHSDEYLPFNADVSSRWKELGRDFDDEVEMSEKLMFMRNKRRRLVQRAYGNVLEVSVGTGRNLDYYDLQGFDPTRPRRRNIITHLTLNDQSGVIIAAAEEKLEKIMSRQTKSQAVDVDLVVGDAGSSGIIKRPDGGFDTIVQTMGVCSMVDPVGFLKRMGQLCRQPGERPMVSDKRRADDNDDDGKGGQILLLEHGRSYFSWLNWILDTGASLHAHRFGCWWNKDIQLIIEQSGLQVETVKRYHGGTTWMIVLRPTAQVDTPEPGRATSIRQIRRFAGS